MTHRPGLTRIIALAAVAALAACEDPSGNRTVPDGELRFIRPAPGAPPLVNGGLVTFVATRGEDADIRLPYTNGHDCLRFRLDDESLQARPDGTPMQDGDTVTITIRLVDPASFNFEFQPAGLRFSRDEPAELRVSYDYADPDVDGDGDVDEQDSREFDDAGFWRQESAGTPWERIGTARLDPTEELRAELDGFTRYALASN